MTFNFLHHWYPLTPIADIDPKRPTAVTLLGRPLVIWRFSGRDAARTGQTQTYRVFADRCPHRLAPLSEGRVDEQTGHLMCSYHGWQFDDQGVCRSLPQAEANFQPDQQPQLCATVLPCQVANDLLWVWPDPESADRAATTPLPLSPQVDASLGFVWTSYVRDLAYDWQTLVENVADPSHVPFAHHGVQGKRSQAVPLPMQITESTPDRIEAQTGGRFNAQITFEPPCRLEYAIQLGNTGKQVGLVTYCVPTLPGQSRIVVQFPRNFAQTLHYLTPRWFSHIQVRNQVLDGDMVLLHEQERALRQATQSQSWKQAYTLPTTADRLVIEFRNWCDRHCQQPFPWPDGVTDMPSPPSDRRALLDRYHQHTQHCHSCRTALQMMQRGQWGLVGYFVLTLAIVAVLPDPYRLLPGIPLLLLALLGLGVAAWLQLAIIPKFYFVDYIHADRP